MALGAIGGGARRLTLVAGLGLLGLGGLSAGCSNDNAILTGPTPAGVTVDSVPGSVTTTTTGPAQGPAPAEVVASLELEVRQGAGGCWQSFAPGAPAGVSRQDVWFASTGLCQGNGWSVALQVFPDAASLEAAAQVPTTAALRLRDDRVLVVVAPSATASVRALLGGQPGVQVVPASS